MARYQVLPGVRHGALNQYGPGDIIEMDPAEAAGFADKLAILSPLPADSAESASPSDSAEYQRPRAPKRK